MRGRRPALSSEDVDAVRLGAEIGMTQTELARIWGVSRATIGNIYKRNGIKGMTSDRLLTFNRQTKPLKAWAEELGISRDTLQSRLWRGRSVEEALTVPILYQRLGLKD